jgi:carbon-monoxide dehydrogenase medium subunit
LYPASFEYYAPESLDEALSILERFGDEAKLLAGGQSLIPLMRLRFAAPRALVDLRKVEGLDKIDASNGHLNIGALVTHRTCEHADGLPGVISSCAPQISDPIVRNVGTVGGSLAHADPQGDWGAVMLALRGEVVARSTGGERTIPIDDFFQGPFMSSLQPNEAVTEVRVHDRGPREGGAYMKLKRRIGDYATVGVAVHLSLGNGGVERAGIGLTGVGPANMRAEAAEEALAENELGDEAIAEAGRLAAEAAQPRSDERGSEDYKRQVVRVYTERGLREAAEAARA